MTLFPSHDQKWDGYYNLESVINDSKLRISKNELFSLIDQNAKWFSWS